MKKKLLRLLKKPVLILTGSFVFALSLSLLLSPVGIVTGGVSGVAILLDRLLPLGTGTLFLILNIPIILTGLFKFGKYFMISTVAATLLSSLFTDLLSLFAASFLPLTDDLLLVAIFGGASCGVGLGLGEGVGVEVGGRLAAVFFQVIER